MTPAPRKNRTYQVNSLDRAFGILGCFTLSKPELSLSEICDKTGLPKPTAFRLLSAMESAQFISRTQDGQRYQVGIRAFELGNIFLANLSIEQLARPYMESISEQYKMTCNLAILDQGQVVYIATVNRSNLGRFSPITGYRHYVHCSALGKSLIADLPETEILDILERHGMPALSPHTYTTPKALLSDLEAVRDCGYAVDAQEGGIGMNCLATAIFDHRGQRVAAISVSGATPLFTPDQVSQIVETLKQTAREISSQLGFKGFLPG